MNPRRFSQVCLSAVVALCLVIAAPAIAQEANARVSGIVTDPSKAVITGANIVAVNIDTNVRFPTKTNGSGIYVLSALPVGDYRIEVEHIGFKSIVEPGVVLHTQDALELNFEMALGSASEIVTVNGSATNDSPAVSTVIDQAEIANMPLNGNSLSTLFELTPGVVTNAGGGGAANGGGLSVDGQRPTTNYLEVDGASENIYIPPGNGPPNATGAGIPVSASGGTNGLLPIDAVEEFRMQTSSYDAEFGRTPGGQIEVRTRGGTNVYHGSLFENFRNQVMDSTDWFIGYDNAAYGEDLKQSPLRMNDFGGTFGGPILKNRLFFFGAHESLLMDQPQTPRTFDVPDEETRTTAATAIQPVLAVYPSPTGGPDPKVSGSDFYTFNHSNAISDHSTSLRIDDQLSRTARVFFRVNDAPSSTTVPYPTYGNTTDINILTLTSGFSWTITPRTLNEITANYSAYNTDYVNTTSTQAFAQAVSSLANTSKVAVGFEAPNWPGLLTAVPNNLPATLHQFNILDSLSFSFGKHTLKMGVDYRRVTPTVSTAPNLYLYMGFSSPTDFQTGTVDFVTYQSFGAGAHVALDNVSLYASDAWKVATRLTLNLGLRWEYSPSPAAAAPGLIAMRGDPADPAGITTDLTTNGIYQTRYDNFAPRVGFSYGLRGGDRFGTTLRGGGGVFFDTGQTSAILQSLLLAYPYLQTVTVNNVPFSSASVNQLQPQLQAYGFPEYTVTLTDPDLAAPRTYSWSLTVDQKIGEQTSLSTTYVGNGGHDLLKDNAYQGLSPSLTPSYGYLYVYTNGENSSYNALQMQLRHRATKNLNILASYTWAHALDNGSNDFESVAGYYKNYKADSDNDIRQIFASAIHYSPNGFTRTRLLKGVTGGWSLDTIALLQSAAPWSVYSYSTTLENPNLYNTYADVVPGVPTVVSGSQCAAETGFPCPGGEGLNPAAFVAAPGTRDGTSARNGYRLFGLKQWDLSASRSWPLWENSNVTLRVDAFNIVNTPNFSGVDTGVGDTTFGEATSTYASAYGSTSASTGSLNQVFSNGAARSLQLSLRIKF